MSRFQVLVAIRVEYKRVLRDSGDVLRALADANKVAFAHASTNGEAVELRRAALRGCDICI